VYPVLCRIGPVEIRTWGVMVAIGFGVATVLTARRARREGISSDTIVEMVVCVALGAFVLARVAYVALELDYYLRHPWEIVRYDFGGLSFHGGLLGGVAAGYAYVRRARLPFWHLLDISTPYIALAYSIARIGCFLNGCCYGVPTSLPWGVTFFDVPRHPTQLYAAVLSFAIYLYLVRLKTEDRPFVGSIFVTYLGLYSASRFAVESLRVAEHVLPWLTVAQAASAVIGVGAGVVLWVGRRASRGTSSGG